MEIALFAAIVVEFGSASEFNISYFYFFVDERIS